MTISADIIGAGLAFTLVASPSPRPRIEAAIRAHRVTGPRPREERGLRLHHRELALHGVPCALRLSFAARGARLRAKKQT